MITGGAGFIGSHLAEALLARGYEVVALDDLSTGRLSNIQPLIWRPGFRFVHGTVLDAAVVEKEVRECHWVCHFAAAVGVKLIVEAPLRTIETNADGTRIVLQAARRHRRAVFLASTSEVYGRAGRPVGDRFRESDDLHIGASLRWCYASSKLLDEHLARAYAETEGVAVVIGRFFNIVGPRQSDAYGMVVPRFIRQALAGQPITVHGDGTQVRCFGWVGDAVSATRMLMENPHARGEVFNIGSAETVTVRDLAERIRTLTDSRSEIVHIPYEEAYGVGFQDVRYRAPDLLKIQTLTDYRPTKRLDQILVEVIRHESGVGGAACALTGAQGPQTF